MSNLSESISTSPFDSIRRTDEQGEYWLARELAPMLGYDKWQNFHKSITSAIENLELTNDKPSDHITVSSNMVKRNQGGGRSELNYRLSRYGAYMIALCCDGRKIEVASAKKYFAVKAREAETVIPAQNAEIEKLKIQLAIAQANNSTVLAQERLMLTGASIVSMHGASMLALIQGRPDAVVYEKEIVRETVMVDANYKPVATFDGVGITEIANRLGFGTNKKAITDCRKWLESVGIKDEDWRQEMTAHASAKLPRELMPKLKQMWAQRKGNRQMLIGE